MQYAPSEPQAGWTIAELLSQIPHHRPGWFRYALRDFRGSRHELEQSLIEQLEAASEEETRLRLALLLVGLGREEGVARVIEALASPEPQATLYAIKEMAALISNQVDAGPIALTAPQVAQAARPWLESPRGETGWEVVEFALDHAYSETENLTRSLLRDPRPGLRSRIACAFLRQGRDDGALETLRPIILEAPITESEEREVWAFRARQFADSLEVFLVQTEQEPQALAERLVSILRDALKAPRTLQASDWFARVLRTAWAADAPTCRPLLAEVTSSPTTPPLIRACAALLGLPSKTISIPDAMAIFSELLQDETLREYVRVAEAKTWAQQLQPDPEARPQLIRVLSSTLHRPVFAATLADTITDLGEGRGRDEAARALLDALEEATDPDARNALALALSNLGDFSESTLSALPAWQATQKRWELSGITIDKVHERLRWSGAATETTPEAIVRASSASADSAVLNLLEGRIIIAPIRDSDSQLDPKELASTLITAILPPLQTHPENEGGEAGYEIDPRPILNALNETLQSAGRSERFFRLAGPEGADDYAFFLIADGSRFPAVAKELSLPLIP